MTDQHIRSFEATIDDVQPGERSVVAKINTDAVDRYRTVILPGGADLEGYRRNPVVLWEHGKDPARGNMPIGKNQWIKTTERGIVAKTIFKDDAYSQEIFRCYQEEYLRGWSVRMVNPEYGPPTREELRSRPEWRDAENVFRKWEMGEYSGVAIPGNKDTLTILASRGIWLPDETRTATDSSSGFAVQAGVKKKGKKDPDKETEQDDEDEDADEEEKDKKPKADKRCYVDANGDTWNVFSPDGLIVCGFQERALADEYVRLMYAPSNLNIEYQLQQSLGDIRRASEDAKQMAREMIALYVDGRI